MLRTLLSPLSARFAQPPSTPRPTNSASLRPDEFTPEDFARDVLIELMRNSVERLKAADTETARFEVLNEIHRIMLENACTKDVFREMDGFLVVTSVLSGLYGLHMHELKGSANDTLEPVIDGVRLVFVILSEAMHSHKENTEYFKESVGYEPLSEAMIVLVSNPDTVKTTLGFLVSLALHDFSFSGLFANISAADFGELDRLIQELSLGRIHHPGALRVLFDFMPLVSAHDAMLRYAILKLLERLSYHSHRNHAQLNDLGLVGPLFRRFCASRDDPTFAKQERQLVLKFLKRLLDMGVSTQEGRTIFQQAITADDALDIDVLEILLAGMKARWPAHFLLESPAALLVKQANVRGLPSTGFTFMMWMWVETLPTNRSDAVFSVRVGNHCILALSIRPDGMLHFRSAATDNVAVFKGKVVKSRWTHITLVHYPHKGSNPTIRLFVDGILVDSLSWTYPKPVPTAQDVTYVVGDSNTSAIMRWCFASSYLIAAPLADVILRFIHHLGPRYTAKFQSTELAKFLTYEASASLGVFLANTVNQAAVADRTHLLQIIKAGLGISEATILFVLETTLIGEQSSHTGDTDGAVSFEGDIMVSKKESLDLAMWKIGGAAVPLRLVQLANSPHEVSRSLGILSHGLRNSWQNSEDMERLRGYEILAEILRSKSHLINVTGFETLFEFLGLNFRSTDHSTVVNMIAYRTIALDFQLWSQTRNEIQHAHLEHFTTLLHTSKHKVFNCRSQVSKMALVRKLLFALQTDWYQPEMLPALVETLKVAAQANFSAEEAIKPLTSYLAANLHEVPTGATSPRSVISRIDHPLAQQKAERVLEMVLSILQSPAAYTRFAAALPLTRIFLLLLGDHPSPVTAALVLRLIQTSLAVSNSFNRKFELVSGWSILKSVIPNAWDVNVQNAVFDILFGQSYHDRKEDTIPMVVCPYIVPTIFSSLHCGLVFVAKQATNRADSDDGYWTEQMVEGLLEELIKAHSTVPTFRQVFKSQTTTQIFVDAFKAFVYTVSSSSDLGLSATRILEKLSHLGLSISLDSVVAAPQKQDILNILQSAETALNPRHSQETSIDPSVIVDGKSRRNRFSSLRLSVQLGERTVTRSITRIQDWRKVVIATERKRLRKTVLDLREHRRQVSNLTKWTSLLTMDRGLWAKHHDEHVWQWRLDETEGPYRIRKKLELDSDKSVDSKVDVQAQFGNVRQLETDKQSLKQSEVPPWAESYEFSSTDTDVHQLDEEVEEDNYRRVRHELEPEDVIVAASTVARISGVDSSPGLLICGRTHIYMLDGLVENEDGEVVDAHDASKRLFFVPGSIVELNGPQRAQRWSYDQVAAYTDRMFLFRDVALEIYFKDSRSLLVVFLEKARRQEMGDRLASFVSASLVTESLPSGLIKSPMVGRLSAKVLSGFGADELSIAQRRWQAREISNFTYLSILNQISGRTPNDATQYPVFPWVISDYTSDCLDLKSSKSFRDLARPMGALTLERRDVALSRYSNLQSVGETPFHYGTHFSSSMIVCHFLIRLEPFAHMFKTLQGGDWDLPDRLFSDIPRAYQSASEDIRGDVRELIPEFYACPEFLENSANLDFGVQQQTGERIHNVKLPPWAKQDPLLFIVLNREALESDFVSENIPAWIDLIWGYKQRDRDSINVYHPLSYAGSIDLDAITDDLQREATVGIIHNFGQTPRKLFSAPHPERLMHGHSTLPLGTIYGITEDYHLLSQGDRAIKDLGQHHSVYELVVDAIGDRVIPCPLGTLVIPSHPHEHIEWDTGMSSNGELKVFVDRKVVQVVEAALCCCAAFADANTLVTGSNDHTVRLWRAIRGSSSSSSLHNHKKDGPLGVYLTHVMRAHTSTVISIAASRAWSLVVSGSKDGSAALWDLNRGIYVRSIWHGDGGDAEIHLVAINESTGYIATCSRHKLCLHTINARHIVTMDLTNVSAIYPPITSLAFHEREYSHVGVLATGGPEGVITLLTWNTDRTPKGEKARWEFVALKTLQVKGSDGARLRRGLAPCVTSLKFVGEVLYHGEDSGKVFRWDLPD